MNPILKWAGGKRKLLSEIKRYISLENIGDHAFYEPFLGGGAVCFGLECRNAVVNDLNQELMNVYKQVRDRPKELIRELKKHAKNHSHDHYYQTRNLERTESYRKLPDIKKAARFIYLNKTCYNGLYRVNLKGYFNVPLGRYKNPDIVMAERITELSSYLNNNNIQLLSCDFEKCIEEAKAGDVVYFDPPYDYEDGGFTAYSFKGFSREDLIRLEKTCSVLVDRGCVVLVSNNDTEFVNKLFSSGKYIIEHIEAPRFISCNGKNRCKAKDVLIYGRC